LSLKEKGSDGVPSCVQDLASKTRVILCRRLSQIRLIYCGCAGVGKVFRSFSIHRPNYSPQTIEKSASIQHNLLTITNLRRPPIESCSSKIFLGWPGKTLTISPLQLGSQDIIIGPIRKPNEVGFMRRSGDAQDVSGIHVIPNLPVKSDRGPFRAG